MKPATKLFALFSLAAVAAGGWPGVGLAADSFAITATERRVERPTDAREREAAPGAKRAPDPITSKVAQKAFAVKIENRSFQAAEGLEVRYIVFVERQMIGTKEGDERLQRLFGKVPVETIKPHGTFEFETVASEIKEARLDGDYYFKNGGARKAEDRLAGLWVRLYRGEEMVAEFTRPVTLAQKEEWREQPDPPPAAGRGPAKR